MLLQLLEALKFDTVPIFSPVVTNIGTRQSFLEPLSKWTLGTHSQLVSSVAVELLSLTFSQVMLRPLFQNSTFRMTVLEK